VVLPGGARSPSTRLMWWQPQNSGVNMDQWALDELVVSRYEDLRNIDDDFDAKPVTKALHYYLPLLAFYKKLLLQAVTVSIAYNADALAIAKVSLRLSVCLSHPDCIKTTQNVQGLCKYSRGSLGRGVNAIKRMWDGQKK